MVEPIELEPRYSTMEMPGKCIKCLAEQEYGIWLRELLKGERNKELKERFEAVLALLQSPDLTKLVNESERHLSDGKEVKLIVHFNNGQLSYELKLES